MIERRDIGLPNWQVATKFDVAGCALADRHYSRRSIGAPQFMPPGQTVVLVTRDERAVFGWWRPHPASGIVAMNRLDGWTCTIFRNEGGLLSSNLILEAEVALRLLGHGCGPDGLLTYVWSSKIASSNPGYCFQRAGWTKSGSSADGKKILLRKAFDMATSAPASKVIDQLITDRFAIYNGDCVDVIKALPDASVHYSIFSPPFASLYTYSASARDMGNCTNHEEFYRHFEFLVPQLLRVTKPGRLLSFHCMNLPTSKARDGIIGISDFRGILIKAFQDAGWIYHSEVCIWKDPVTAMQRTKALGLLWKTLKKDSAMSRQGIADWLITFAKEPSHLVTMRKRGDNPEPIAHEPEEFPVEMWQRYASPVWMDINPSNTLQRDSAREEKDERHICPLQLDVIERAVKLWTNPGDLVLSPFAGIGSEGVVALREGRRFVGAELKPSYYEQAAKNLAGVEEKARKQLDMFGGAQAAQAAGAVL